MFCVCEVNYEVCTDSKFANFIKLKEITVTVSKHLILVCIDFLFYFSSFSLGIYFDSEDISNTQDRV